MRLTRRSKKRLLLLGLIGFAVVAAGVGYAAYRTIYRDHRAKTAYEEARVEYEAGQYEEALGKLSYYVARFGEDTEALIMLADARSKVPLPNGQHFVGAIGRYRVALSREPENMLVLERLLDLYKTVGWLNEGVETAKRIVEIDEEHIEALEALMEGRRLQGAYAERHGGEPGSAHYSARLVELVPDDLGYRQAHLSNLDLAGANADTLLATVDQWVEEYKTDDGGMLLLRAFVLGLESREEEARAAIDQAVEKGAGSREHLEFMVGLLDMIGRHTDSDRLIANAREQFQDEPAFAELKIRRAWQAGRLREAETELALAMDQFEQKHGGLLRLSALIDAARGEEENARKAIAALETLAKNQSPDERRAEEAWAQALRARLEITPQTRQHALEAFEEAIALNPDDPILYYLAGEALFAQEEYDRAASSFARAYEAAGRVWVAAGASYVESLLQIGRFADAYREAVGLVTHTSPQYLHPWRLWFEAWLLMEERGLPVPDWADRAESRRALVATLEEFYQSNELDTLVPYLVRAYLLRNETGEARALIETTLAREEVGADVVESLAMLSIERDLGFDDELIARFENAAANRPDYEPALVNLKAQRFLKQGEPERGLELIEALIAKTEAAGLQSRGFWRMRTTYLIDARLPGVPEAIDQILSDPEASTNDLSFVLTLPETWESRELANRAIGRMRGAVGDVRSRRLVLAEATRVLQFESDDQEEIAGAVRDLDELLNRSPDLLPALTTLAAMHLIEDLPDRVQSARRLRQAIDRYPGQTQLYPRLIDLLQQLGDYQTAQRYLYELGRQTNLDESLQREQLRLLKRQGDFETAFERLSEMLGESASSTDKLHLATLSLKAGRPNDARRIVDDLLAQGEPDWLTLRFAADLYAAQGEVDRAVQLLETADVPGGEAARAMLLGSFYFGQGYHELAGEWIVRAVKEHPGDPNAWLLLAQYHLTNEAYTDAQRAASEGLKHDPENESLRAVLASAGLASSEQQVRREAIAFFKDIEGENDALLETLTLFDRVSRGEGEISATAADLREAKTLVEQYATFLPAWRLAVTMHAAANRHSEALALVNSALAKMPHRAEPAIWATELNQEMGRVTEAMRFARIWRERALEDPIEADVAIAVLQLANNEAASALQTLSPHASRIIAQRDALPGRFNLWMQVLLRNQEVDRAYAAVAHDQTPRPHWLNPWLETSLRLEVTYARHALSLIERVARRTPEGTLDLATAWTLLGERTGNEEFFAAGERLAVELSAAPADLRVAAMRLRAMLYSARGDFEEAARAYERVLEADPRDAMTMNNLAYILGIRLGRTEDGLEWSAQAVDAGPEVPDFLDTHAALLLEAGRADEAEPYARQAHELRPNDPEIMLTLAGILARQGDASEARRLLQNAERAIQLAPFEDRNLSRKLEDVRAMVAESN